MTQDDLYDNIVASILKLAKDFIAAEAPQATFVNWDSHASIDELPPGTIIGPAGCGMSEESESRIEVIFALGVATADDPNNFMLTKLISKLRARVRPQTRITIFDHDTAAEASWMVTQTPIAITPVTRAMVRAMQFVECRALIDLSATSMS